VFNFAVGAAEYALTKEGINKVSILDWDVHFGNGVSDLVKSDDRIRYASTHQMDIFPGGLAAEENWKGPTENLLNVGIDADSGKEPYLEALKSTILPFLLDDEDHSPDLLIICAGYDSLSSDPMANVSLKPEDFHDIASTVKEAAEAKDKQIHMCLGLEGGYNLQELPIAIEETLRAFAAS
jgi:acetoin utilization deacetylase AcuC-like enzyme